MTLDVTSPGSRDQVVQRTTAAHGRVDVLVDDAGIHLREGVLEAERDDWNTVVAVGTTGVRLGVQLGSDVPCLRAWGTRRTSATGRSTSPPTSRRT